MNVSTEVTTVLLHIVPLKITLEAIVHEPSIDVASKDAVSVPPAAGYNRLPGSNIKVLDQYET